MWHRDGRKMATGQYRSALSFDDVAQKSILARSAHQNNSERTSKLLEEQCDEFVSLVSVRFQGVKTIDVIERNGLPKNSVALEPGELEVDFACVFSTFSWAHKGVFGPAGASTMPPNYRTDSCGPLWVVIKASLPPFPPGCGAAFARWL